MRSSRPGEVDAESLHGRPERSRPTRTTGSTFDHERNRHPLTRTQHLLPSPPLSPNPTSHFRKPDSILLPSFPPRTLLPLLTPHSSSRASRRLTPSATPAAESPRHHAGGRMEFRYYSPPHFTRQHQASPTHRNSFSSASPDDDNDMPTHPIPLRLGQRRIRLASRCHQEYMGEPRRHLRGRYASVRRSRRARGRGGADAERSRKVERGKIAFVKAVARVEKVLEKESIAAEEKARIEQY